MTKILIVRTLDGSEELFEAIEGSERTSMKRKASDETKSQRENEKATAWTTHVRQSEIVTDSIIIIFPRGRQISNVDQELKEIVQGVQKIERLLAQKIIEGGRFSSKTS